MRDVNEIFKLTGKTISELILDYETKYMTLKYKGVTCNKNNQYIITVFDEKSKCQFELVLNEDTLELEIYRSEQNEK